MKEKTFLIASLKLAYINIQQKSLTNKEYADILKLQADIQNNLGEMTEILNKFNLKYDG